MQDQYFDLTKLDKEAAKTHSDSALKAVVEGDAVRVQRLYEKKLSADDQAAYEAARSEHAAAATDEIHDKGVPDSISTFVPGPVRARPDHAGAGRVARRRAASTTCSASPPTTDASYLTPGDRCSTAPRR